MVAGQSITGSWAGSAGCGFEQAEHARTGGRKSNEGETVPVEYSGVKTVMLSETKGPKEEKPEKQLKKRECRRM